MHCDRYKIMNDMYFAEWKDIIFIWFATFYVSGTFDCVRYLVTCQRKGWKGSTL